MAASTGFAAMTRGRNKTMMRLEIHAGEGGADAAAFAAELATSIAKHSGRPARFEGGAWTLERL